MIKVYLNRKVSETQITIGNQYESGVNAIDFDLSELKQKWPNGNIYLLVSRKKHTWPYSIDDGEFKIEYVLTWKRGFYQMNVVVTDEKITDQLESSNTIFVSDTINAYVNENQINAKALNEQELPRELQIVYDDLITLKKNIEKDLADGKYIGPQGPRGEKGEPGEKGDPGDVTEEYRNLAGQIAQNASDAQASATNAQISASNAQKILDDTKEFANQTKKELNQIKADTNTLKEEANASAVNAKASETKAKEYADNLQASTEDVSKLKEDLVANQKEDAKTKRSLSALWDLNNGISYRFETDSEKAYQKKVPSGAKLGSVNKVGGKTIVMNQIFKIESSSANGLTFSVDNDGLITINGTSTSYYTVFSQINDLQNKEGKFFVKMTVIENPNNVAFRYGYSNRSKFTDVISSGSTSKIFTQTKEELVKGKYQGLQGFQEGTVFNNVKIKIMICDLTKMFGSGNEPSTPEEFEAMFPNDYYPYNEGELMSMSVNDVIYTDTSSNQVSHQISQSILSLDGYGWSAGQAYNYVDFENKKYYKCVDKIDLGTFTWLKSGSTLNDALKVFVSNTNIESMKIADTGRGKNFICDKFNLVNKIEAEYNAYDFVVEPKTSFYPLRFCVPKDFCTDESDFKKKVEGTALYYELAEPIVTDISDIIGDTFQEPFEVESGGSLTFKNTNGDGYQVAVPSDIQYVVALSEVNA